MLILKSSREREQEREQERERERTGRNGKKCKVVNYGKDESEGDRSGGRRRTCYH